VADQPNQHERATIPLTLPSGPEAASGEREVFTAEELAVVLSHYDVGVIESIRPFLRGSRRSPKVYMRTERGERLLKRRAQHRCDPKRVAFAHEFERYLRHRDYPVPKLFGTRHERNSMLQHNGYIYELFEFVNGRRYDRSVPATRRAGRALGVLHHLARDFQSQFTPEATSYHGVDNIESTVERIPQAVAAVAPEADTAALRETCRVLIEQYRHAGRQVDDAGYRDWPKIALHGDWHPGNLIYSVEPKIAGTSSLPVVSNHQDKDAPRGETSDGGAQRARTPPDKENVTDGQDEAQFKRRQAQDPGRVIAVVDFDSSRCEPRVADVANGVLQFSINPLDPEGGGDMTAGLDRERLQAMLTGYDQVPGQALADSERAVIAWLMIETLILESVIPIAATGRFAHLPGEPFLAMVRDTVQWIVEHREVFTSSADMPATSSE